MYLSYLYYLIITHYPVSKYLSLLLLSYYLYYHTLSCLSIILSTRILLIFVSYLTIATSLIIIYPHLYSSSYNTSISVSILLPYIYISSNHPIIYNYYYLYYYHVSLYLTIYQLILHQYLYLSYYPV